MQLRFFEHANKYFLGMFRIHFDQQQRHITQAQTRKNQLITAAKIFKNVVIAGLLAFWLLTSLVMMLEL